MAQKDGYLFRGRSSERKFLDLLHLFALDITADRADELTGLNHTPLALYRLLRARMAGLAQAGCPFKVQDEIDGSYFGPPRVRGARDRGAGRKTLVFGILERGRRVHCQIVKTVPKQRFRPSSRVVSPLLPTSRPTAFRATTDWSRPASPVTTGSTNTAIRPDPSLPRKGSISTGSRASGAMPSAGSRRSTACAEPASRTSSRRPNSTSTTATKTSTKSCSSRTDEIPLRAQLG